MLSGYDSDPFWKQDNQVINDDYVRGTEVFVGSPAGRCHVTGPECLEYFIHGTE